MTARTRRLALVAHDAKKQDFADFVATQVDKLAGFELWPTRLAAVYDIPMALNRATAERIIDTLG